MKEKILIIEDIKEIEKYKILDEKVEEEYYKNVKIYDFTKICKVIFKCDIPLGFLNFLPELDMEEFDKNFGNPDCKIKYEPYDVYYFFAKNVVFEKSVNLHTLIAENVKIKGDSVIEFVDVSNNLKCNKIYSFKVFAKNIVANVVTVGDNNSFSFKTFSFKTLKAK